MLNKSFENKTVGKVERLKVGSRVRWNTGRTYTEHGQRMAAQSVGDCVVMVDYDRMVEYMLPQCSLDVSAIMQRYDANDRTSFVPSAYRQIAASLNKYASKLS